MVCGMIGSFVFFVLFFVFVFRAVAGEAVARGEVAPERGSSGAAAAVAAAVLVLLGTTNALRRAPVAATCRIGG